MKTTDIKLFDVTLYWCKHNTLDELSGKYQIDLSCLSPKQVEQMENAGLTLKNKDNDQGFFYKASSKYPIIVMDSDGNELTETKISNGTKATVYGKAKPWKVAGKSGVKYYITRVYVTELIEYKPEAKEEVVEEEGDF